MGVVVYSTTIRITFFADQKHQEGSNDYGYAEG